MTARNHFIALKRYGFGDDKRYHCFVADDPSKSGEGSTKVVGILLYTWMHKVYTNYTLMFIEDLIVEEEYRGRGIGRRLMEKAISVRKKFKSIIRIICNFVIIYLSF